MSAGRRPPRPASAPLPAGPAQRRDEAADQRDVAGAERDRAGDDRDDAAQNRDDAGNVRDELAQTRDDAGDLRDEAARVRDRAARGRDIAAERRDREADVRDALALQGEAGNRSGSRSGPVSPTTAWADVRSAVARRDAAGDRLHAARDREAGAAERTEAGDDRVISLTDRDSGASERAEAEADRGSSQSDRDSGAEERVEAGRDRSIALGDRAFSSTALANASKDGLTGVYTRAAGTVELQREVDRARRTGQSLVLAFLDVDGLKAVNDAGGHAAGDRVLVRVAEALRTKLRPYDLIVRYGGDEFVCALAGASSADADQCLQRVRAVLAAGAEPASVTAGTTDLRPGDTLELMLGRADANLYRQR